MELCSAKFLWWARGDSNPPGPPPCKSWHCMPFANLNFENPQINDSDVYGLVLGYWRSVGGDSSSNHSGDSSEPHIRISGSVNHLPISMEFIELKGVGDPGMSGSDSDNGGTGANRITSAPFKHVNRKSVSSINRNHLNNIKVNEVDMVGGRVLRGGR